MVCFFLQIISQTVAYFAIPIVCGILHLALKKCVLYEQHIRYTNDYCS